MKKTMLSLIVILSLGFSGCVTCPKMYRPNADMTGVSQDKYERDLNQCRDSNSVGAGEKAAAAARAFLGPLACAGPDTLWDENASNEVKETVNNCMRSKGYAIP